MGGERSAPDTCYFEPKKTGASSASKIMVVKYNGRNDSVNNICLCVAPLTYFWSIFVSMIRILSRFNYRFSNLKLLDSTHRNNRSTYERGFLEGIRVNCRTVRKSEGDKHIRARFLEGIRVNCEE